jgi:hypothetical protein
LSDPEKAVITLTCQRFIDEVLKPRFLPTIRPTQFNYPIDILGRWHGNRYRFVQRYRFGQPETLGEEFDAPFTRLDWISRDRFDIQWHRHTGTWFCLHRRLSLVEALKTIEGDGLLHTNHSKSAFTMSQTDSPLKASSPRCSPDAYDGLLQRPVSQAGMIRAAAPSGRRSVNTLVMTILAGIDSARRWPTARSAPAAGRSCRRAARLREVVAALWSEWDDRDAQPRKCD